MVDSGDDNRSSDGTVDGSTSRRDVLRGLSSGAAVGIIGTGDGWTNNGSRRIGSDDRTAPARTQAGGTDPIPDSITVSAGGKQFTAPVERRIVRGTCQDFANFINSGGMRGIEDRGEQAGTVSGSNSSGTTSGSGDQRTESPSGTLQSGFDCSDLPWWEGSEPEQGDGAAVAWTEYEWLVNGVPIAGETYETILGPDPIGNVLTVEYVDVGGSPGGRLEITDIDISMSVDIDVVVPDWHPSHAISDECRQAWCSYIRQIIDHERQHVQNLAKTAVETEQDLNNVGRRLPEDVASGGGSDPYSVIVNDPAERETKEEQLVNNLTWILGNYLDLATCRRKRRTREFHARESSIETFCERCIECGEYDYTAITDFDAWTLYIQYGYSLSDQVGDYSERYSGRYHGTFELEPYNRGSFLRAMASIFGDLANGTGRVLKQLLGGSRDPVPDFGEQLVFDGTGTVSASHVGETRSPTGVSRTVAAGSKDTEGTAQFEIRRDENEYILSWPALELPGLLIQEQGVTEITKPMHTGEVAMMQAQGRGLAGGAADAADVVDDGSINSSDVDELAEIGKNIASRWPIEGCERTLTQRIGQQLHKRWDTPAGGREMVSPNFDGPVVGVENLSWQIVPGGEKRPADSGHLTC